MSMYSVDQWQNEVPVKEVNGTFPQFCYDDGNFPLQDAELLALSRRLHYTTSGSTVGNRFQRMI